MNKEIEGLLEEFGRYNLGSLNNRPTSVDRYLKYLTHFFNQINKPVDDIDLDDIQDYMICLNVEKKNSVNTQRVKQSSIKLFFGWYSTRYHKDNPADLIGTIMEEVKVPVMPTPNELVQMVYACDPTTFMGRRDAAIICLLADTGIRLGECVALNIENIQVYKNNFVCIVPRRHGVKGRHERMIEFGELTQGALIGEMFSAYYTDIKYVHSFKPGDPLFKQDGIKYKGDRLGKDGIAILIRKYRGLAEIDRQITPKSFRHFFGTYSTINGTKLQHLKQLMGHAWIETTQRYVHWAEVIKADSLKKRGTTGLRSKESSAGFAKIVKDAHGGRKN